MNTAVTLAPWARQTLQRVRSKNVIPFDPSRFSVESRTRATDPFMSGTSLRDFLSRNRATFTAPMAQSPWIYSAIDAKARNIASVPFVVRAGSIASPDDRGEPVPETAPIQRLWHKPNPNDSETTFWYIVDAHLEHHGEATIVMLNALGNPANPAAGEIPAELWPVDPCVMQHVTDSTGTQIVEWTIGNASAEQRSQRWPAHSVLHIRLPNIYDPLRGLAPLRAAELTAKTEHSAALYSSNLMENGGSPGGILTTDLDLDDEIRGVVRNEWNARHSGAGNAGRVAVLSGGLKYQPLAGSNKDMEFSEQRKWNREEILGVFGVPRLVVGIIDDVNRNTAHVVMRIFWQETLLPRIRLIQDELWAKLFLPLSQSQRNPRTLAYWGEFDVSRVEALHDLYDDKLTQATKLADLGYGVNDINRRLSLGMPDVSWGSEGLKQAQLVPISVLHESPGQFVSSSAPSNDSGTPKAKTKAAIYQQRSRALARMSPRERAAALYRALVPGERAMERGLVSWFNENTILVRNGFARVIGRRALSRADAPPLSEAEIEDILGSVERWERSAVAATRSSYGIVGLATAEGLASELGGFRVLSVDLSSAWLRTGLARQTGRYIAIGRDERKLIREVILKTINRKGLTDLRAIQQSVQQTMRTFPSYRAARIARTETGTLANGLRYDGMSLEGVSRHSWSTADDDVVRPDLEESTGNPANHRKLEGQIRKIGSRFSNGLLFPLDPSGHVNERANCRCLALAELEVEP